ncbi:TPA: RHS repeat protein, partial [Salmonella enterica]|nr:RHS repeat protein [Salmonella enterica]
LTHRTVNDELAEQWQYNARGWLTGTSHLSDGHRVSVLYQYDKQGRMCLERQTVHNPETDELLWQHATRHDYPEGLATRTTPDNLPPVEWLTYGSGYLAGMKLGDTPLIDFTRDRLHRETQRTAGAYEQNTLYSATGRLLSHTFSDPVLNREYGYNGNGQLVRIRGAHQEEDYRYDGAGRLVSARHNDLLRRHATDPAGNRITDREQYPALPAIWRDNRIGEDVAYFYHHDAHGRLTEKDERQIRDGGGYVHHYHYDNRHRLVHYRREQQGITLLESRYLYDPPGRRIGKRVWKSRRERGSLSGEEYIYLDKTPEVTWYGWDGDRLTTTETATQRIQTIYLPGSFTPLVRIETRTAELAKAVRRTLAEKFQQEANVTFPPELVAMVDSLEVELQRGELSEASRAWLAQCGLTPEQIQNQLEPEYIPERKIHLYHCDHRGLPLALVSIDGKIEWSAEYDAWGNVQRENNPHNLKQLIRLPGQQCDEETGLYYNRHRYYDPLQGRYITQDPIGLRGGWNPYTYPLNPLTDIDPLGLFTCEICSRVIDEANNSLDNLPFNPTKMLTASLNTANSARLYASGATKLGIGVAADGTVILSPVGTASMAWGVWNIKSATASYNRANLLLSESLNETGKDRCWRNLLGVLPYGEQFDDPGEPSLTDVYKEKFDNMMDSPMNFIEEIGTLMF